jgi:hypothetical protein
MTSSYVLNSAAVKNTAFTYHTALFSQADTKLIKTSPTLAAGDVKVSIDGGNFTNVGTLPTQIQTTGVLVGSLTAAEMNGNVITLLFHDAAGAEWCDLLVVIETVTAVAMLGAGAVAWTVTITVGGLARDGVDVWVTTDLAGSNVVARGTTDALGHVTFMLDAGAYYAWKQLAGITFTNPEGFTVTP